MQICTFALAPLHAFGARAQKLKDFLKIGDLRKNIENCREIGVFSLELVTCSKLNGFVPHAQHVTLRTVSQPREAGVQWTLFDARTVSGRARLGRGQKSSM